MMRLSLLLGGAAGLLQNNKAQASMEQFMQDFNAGDFTKHMGAMQGHFQELLEKMNTPEVQKGMEEAMKDFENIGLDAKPEDLAKILEGAMNKLPKDVQQTTETLKKDFEEVAKDMQELLKEAGDKFNLDEMMKQAKGKNFQETLMKLITEMTSKFGAGMTEQQKQDLTKTMQDMMANAETMKEKFSTVQKKCAPKNASCDANKEKCMEEAMKCFLENMPVEDETKDVFYDIMEDAESSGPEIEELLSDNEKEVSSEDSNSSYKSALDVEVK